MDCVYAFKRHYQGLLLELHSATRLPLAVMSDHTQLIRTTALKHI